MSRSNSTQRLSCGEANRLGLGLLFAQTGFLLTGAATVLLGPLLPMLSSRWDLHDARAGSLVTAQFLGSTAGALLVGHSLLGGSMRRSMIAGYMLCAAGLCGLAMADFYAAYAALFVLGMGLGLAITSTNLLIGRGGGAGSEELATTDAKPVDSQNTRRSGAALSWFNFLWGAGAMLCPLLTAWWLAHAGVRSFLLAFSAVMLAVMAACSTALHEQEPQQAQPSAGAAPVAVATVPAKMPRLQPGLRHALVLFAVMLFLYVGAENILSSWLTTYALRYGREGLLSGAFASSLFWGALTGGRAVFALLLLRVGERVVLPAALLCGLGATVLLALVHAPVEIAMCAVLAGLALAPVFPVVLAMLLSYRVSAAQAGVVLAMSGVGGALFPWLTGIISSRWGSLQAGIALSCGLMAVLLMLSFYVKDAHDSGKKTGLAAV